MNNPLDSNKPFDFSGMNPNPSFSKTKDGPMYRVSFEITQDTWQNFVDANTKGMILAGRLFVCNEGLEVEEQTKPAEKNKSITKKEDDKKGPYGEFAAHLYRDGFFMNPHVRSLLGTDENYQEWTRLQPCVVTGQHDYVELTSGGGLEPRCEYCHVRRSGEAGTSLKPEYSGVPMKHSVHKLQHDKGETEAYYLYLSGKGKIGERQPGDELIAREWFEKKAANNLYRWARERMCSIFNIESLTFLNPSDLINWADERNVTKYLPRIYREYTE
jgi:hypothetical protein